MALSIHRFASCSQPARLSLVNLVQRRHGRATRNSASGDHFIQSLLIIPPASTKLTCPSASSVIIRANIRPFGLHGNSFRLHNTSSVHSEPGVFFFCSHHAVAVSASPAQLALRPTSQPVETTALYAAFFLLPLPDHPYTLIQSARTTSFYLFNHRVRCLLL